MLISQYGDATNLAAGVLTAVLMAAAGLAGAYLLIRREPNKAVAAALWAPAIPVLARSSVS